MKKITLLITLFCLTQQLIIAQVTEAQAYMSQGTNNSLTLTLPSGSEKDAPKTWTSYMKPYGKVEKIKKTDELLINDAKITQISGNTVDVYTKFSGATMTVWFDMGGGYLSAAQHPAPYAAAEQLLNDFATLLQANLTEEELKNEEKTFKKLESEYAKLEKEKATLEKNIADWKAKIAQAEAEIQQNTQDQATKVTEIEVQRAAVEQVKQKLATLKKQ